MLWFFPLLLLLTASAVAVAAVLDESTREAISAWIRKTFGSESRAMNAWVYWEELVIGGYRHFRRILQADSRSTRRTTSTTTILSPENTPQQIQELLQKHSKVQQSYEL